MSGFALRLALRELRGGLAGFRVFLVCLALGVAGIAAVGSITTAIERGLQAEGQAILGGDVSLRFPYRFADNEERAWLEARGTLGTIVDMRSMLSLGEERALTQVKAVDGSYPQYGEVELGEPDAELHDLLAERDEVHGLISEPVLAERLGLAIGDTVLLGGGTFEFRGTLTSEPDRASGGFAMGPRVMVSLEGLKAAGLTQPGTLFRVFHRLRVAPDADLDTMEQAFQAAFPESGARWDDRRNAAPGVSRFVERLGAFLTLVGLASLAVGGVGIAAAVRGYLDRKVPVIAALRTLGATAGTVFAAYVIQIGLIAILGTLIGLLLGGGLVALLGPWLAADLPIPADFALYPIPLLVAALFGMLAAAVFTLWPLAWVRDVRPAELFRLGADAPRRIPSPAMIAVLLGLVVAFVGAIVGLSAAPELALWCIGGLAIAFVVLRGLGAGLAWSARRLSHSGLVRRRPVLRLALGAVGAPGAGTPGVVLALGLGLGVLAGIAQIDANMQRLIKEQLPENSPAFFFVDIQNHQLERFREIAVGTEGAGKLETAPMLRGIITRLDDVPAAEAQIDPAAAWVLRGDRGVSYAAEPPPGAVITDGAWWDADYQGPPLVSFAEEEGRELGLDIGSKITVNILGRPITAEIANLRKVEWRGMGINFIMVLSPGALAGAPHTHIATLYADRKAEAPVMRELGREMPNVTPVLVREQISRVSDSLGKLGAATRWGALAVLLTGLAVLIGTAAAGEQRRTSEAALLKVLGATRRTVLSSFALRSAMTGALAGLVALLWGLIAAWAVTRYVFDAPFVFQPLDALAIVAGGAGVSLLAGLFFARRPLASSPATVLRAAAG